ncbi:solute carrier family 35 member f5 [Citrus sinensis]|uniref:Solute carrier family 35 member f5 n=1 Tax=Citrus sinensis TaxID=2711 RepID=A0ACB8MH22_CITSI|nr:solute carrier family 35 member f5 [Citrus sinensis]
MTSEVWKWGLGLIYIVAVAIIWIAASFVVQSVVDAGVSPFLVTYICNSLFVVYIPIAEIGRYLVDTYGSVLFWKNRKSGTLQELGDSEKAILLEESNVGVKGEELPQSLILQEGEIGQQEKNIDSGSEFVSDEFQCSLPVVEVEEFAAKGRWTRTRVAKVSLLICPFWFLAQLTFNLSLKYTTVTSNTILSSTSSLFTFLVSLLFLGEKFTWVKLVSVLLCMAGTIIVSLGDSENSSSVSATASNPLLGDILSLASAGLYAVYITLIRKKLPDDDGKNGDASMAQFLGFLGLFNLIIFLPVALILHFTKLEPFYKLTLKQFGLIVGKAFSFLVLPRSRLFLSLQSSMCHISVHSADTAYAGLLDNVLSDYLWAKAVLLTTATVATAGLTIQVPLAAVVDSLTGNAPKLLDYLGAVAVIIGFGGINIPDGALSRSKDASLELETENASSSEQEHTSLQQDTTVIS